ncbi:ribonuclease Z [Vibrio owensii]|uniref:ribonuclease Z n=1 Tax=Vibrio owensii TaxID=696485 RepID=UPI002FF0350A
MELYFLGTSSGVPTKSRNVSATALLESKGKGWFLIDCGEATQHQLLHTPLSLNYLQAICITHIHGDHCYGLPGLLASAGMNNRKDPLTIIAPEGIKQWFEATQAFTKLYLPFELHFIEVEQFDSIEIGQFTITATALSHRVPSFAYCFEESTIRMYPDIDKLEQSNIPRGPIWGELVRGNDVEYQGQILMSKAFTKLAHLPRKAIICGDNDTPEKLDSLIEGAHLLVHESTYSEAMKERAGEVGHAYSSQVASYAQTKQVPSLILTHFSPRYQFSPEAEVSIEQIRQEAQTDYSGHLFLAHDLAHYRIDRAGLVEEIKDAKDKDE